jgi:hypothetical protein
MREIVPRRCVEQPEGDRRNGTVTRVSAAKDEALGRPAAIAGKVVGTGIL